MFDLLTPLETVVLRDESADATVALAPSRGGIVTRFFVGDRPVLYLDESTLLDPSKNIRGGVPVLFPSPGALAGERFRHGDATGSMKQHGFARQRPWTVGQQDESSVTLTLESDEVTRAQYPWDFALRFRYWLEGTRLHITQHVENRSASAMPFAMGFHPYFFVPDGEKARASIATTATRAFDNTTKTNVPLARPIDLTLAEVDLHLDEHATLALADGYRVVVSASPEFRRWVLWTLRSKDFVCLEPWTAAGDALNIGDGLIVLPPGHSHELWTEIALVAP
ncbi:MAG: galactose mutarotase [Deltaproteobacteria bacterium]|nr:galactose mutarotase [Deltaproteobacteria bacterium]